MKSKDIKELKKAFNKAGIEFVSINEKGSHPKVTVIFNQTTINYPVANSASDVNWIRQVVRKIKRATA